MDRRRLRLSNIPVPLRSKIVAPYLVLAIVVVVVFANVIMRFLSSPATALEEEQAPGVATVAEAIFARQENQQAQFVVRLARQALPDPALASDDLPGIQAEVDRALSLPPGWSLFLLAPDGHLGQQWGEGLPLPPSGNFSNLSPVAAVQADPACVCTAVATLADRPMLLTAAGIGLDEANGLAGVVLAGLPVSALAQEIAGVAGTDVILFDLAGTPLAATNSDAEGLPELQLSQEEASQARQGLISVPVGMGMVKQVLLPLYNEDETSPFALLGLRQQPLEAARTLAPGGSTLFLALMAGIIATVVLAYILASDIVRPIKELMHASQEVAEGNLEIKVETKPQDELGQLTESFNTMVSELRQRRYLEDLFGRYVGDNIARRILEGEVNLGGQRVWATSLFADIRDFTAFTEKADLTLLIRELNEYYSTMQRVIDAHGGVINKFGGDSILALFGAPISGADHAQQAVTAAMSMMDELSKLNRLRLERGEPPIRIGIGVNTGEMIVGNLGSEQRREYTALGDSVNLAKRLSDLNKETPFDTVFIGATTNAELSRVNGWQIDSLGLVMVKGKVEPVPIFAVMHSTRLKQPQSEA